MSDYRNRNSDDRNAGDTMRREIPTNPNARAAKTAWGWIAATVLAVVVVLAVAFGIGHQPGQNGMNTASNEAPPPAASPMAPAPRTNTMTPPPDNPAAPLSAAPNTPAQRGTVRP